MKVKEFRFLGEGEMIEDGDEFEVEPSDTEPFWVPAKNIGEIAPDPGNPANRLYRRFVGWTHQPKEQNK